MTLAVATQSAIRVSIPAVTPGTTSTEVRIQTVRLVVKFLRFTFITFFRKFKIFFTYIYQRQYNFN